MSRADSIPIKTSAQTLRFTGFAVALVACTLAVFWPVVRCQFLYWDDWDNVAKNPAFNPVSIDSLAYFYTHGARDLYVPVTYTMWGVTAAVSPRHLQDADGITLSPAFFHGLNLLLHCGSVVLAFWILRRLIEAEWPAFFAALLFAVHPVMVEPVAWMSGLKDVLCGGLCLAAIAQYVLYIRAQGPGTKRGLHYALGVVCFVLAMLAKPSAVSLPGVLLAIGVGLLGRESRRGAIELLPWLVLAVPIIVIGKIVQPALSAADVSLWARPFIAGDAVAFYLWKLIWPVTSIIDYGRNPPWLMSQGALMFVTTGVSLAVIGGAWRLRKKFPAAIVGLLVMIGAVLPVLGFVRFDFQWYSTVADHYLYLAMLGPAIALGFVLKRFQSPVFYAGTVVLLLLFSARSFTQIDYWRDMTTLREHVISVYPTSPTGYRVAAFMANQKGDVSEALRQYELALAARPDDVETHFNLANLLLRLRRPDEAVQHYQVTMEKMPDDPKVANNLGIALVSLQQYERAEASFRESIHRDNAYADGHANLGRILLATGRADQAGSEFETALSIDPNNAAAKKGLADLGRLRQ